MDDTVLKEAIVRILKDDVFVDIIRDQVRAAVDSAVAARDAEMEPLKEELAAGPPLSQFHWMATSAAG